MYLPKPRELDDARATHKIGIRLVLHKVVGEQKGFQGEIVAALDIACAYGFLGLLHECVDLTEGSLLGQVKLSRR